jgi:hypothetical protein
LKEKKKQCEFINMMPLIAAWQNTQLADLFLGLYKSIRENAGISYNPPRLAWLALGLEFNMMPRMQPDKTHNWLIFFWA